MEFLTVQQVADILQVHPHQVRSRIRSGQLRAINIADTSTDQTGRMVYRIEREDLQAYIEAKRVSPVTGTQPRLRRRRRNVTR